jgi:hypothetical protein
MGDSSQLEEARFIAYGIILEKELPPIQLERYNFYHHTILFSAYLFCSRFLRNDGSKN